VTCVIGLQWGDEAKGKLVDLLTPHFETVVRYQGGANAGHTIVIRGEKFKLSLIPTGILHPEVQCVITGGVVLHPPKLLSEIAELRGRGVRIDKNLLISDRAHIVFPWHMEEERVLEIRRKNGQSIGTTMRGIGPCYRDKVGRVHAVRLGDLYRPRFADQVGQIVEEKNLLIRALDPSAPPLEAAAILSEYERYAAELRPFVGESTQYLLSRLEEGGKALFEGAQGALLDIDHGTFPFVTSSNSSGAGISSGSGIPGRYLTKILGVVKAYNTRVGGGPFPTEELGDIGQHIRDRGREYGTVTGRPRRCGWFDAVATRYAARVSGTDVLAVMLLDVLSELPEIQICTAYDIDGTRTSDFPSHAEDLERAQPVYETLPGWKKDITGIRKLTDLPAEARKYLDRVSQVIGRPVEIVSVGPDREQTIFA